MTDSDVRGRLRHLLPQGRLLPDDVWRHRHAFLLKVAVAQGLALFAYGLTTGLPAEHVAAEAATVVLLALPGLRPRLGRTVRAAAVTLSLAAASVVLVHVSGGVTEAHFHFFVVVGLVSLYQSWLPFGVALAVVLLHHGVLGTTHAEAVFGSEQAQQRPWLWACVHAAFVLAASLAHLASWRLTEQLGLRDPLTGLANRTLFKESAARLLDEGRREVSVLYVDLDDFKGVNDRLGHAAGDRVLVAVAERLSACTRSGDVVARLGGDEFALLLPGAPDAARHVGERLLRALAEPLEINGAALTIQASVGLATVSPGQGGSGLAGLAHDADIAMYASKAAGKGRLTVFSKGLTDSATAREQLAADLAAAVAAGELEVHYQPSVGLGDGQVLGVEALVRWHHPRRGPVPPNEFIPLAEEKGLISDLGDHVLRVAATQAAAWQRQGHPLDVAVNVSPLQLTDERFPARVRGVLADSGLPARRLVLEVTETALITDVEAVRARLVQLRALGVRVAIDDFGTGYAGLSYLRQLPVDIIKIDQSFVADLNVHSGEVLVSSIVELGRSLGLEIIAEGVETPAQVDALRGLRCLKAQGFHFARPLSADAVSRMLREKPAAPRSPVTGPGVGVGVDAPTAAGRPVTGRPSANRPVDGRPVDGRPATSSPASRRPVPAPRATASPGPAPLTVATCLRSLTETLGSVRALQVWQAATVATGLHGSALDQDEVQRVLTHLAGSDDETVRDAAGVLRPRLRAARPAAR